jgi:type IV secretion system protein TrbL
LFWLLATIEFVWAGLRLALRGADFGEWVAEVVNQILFIGFFLTLLMHSSEWAGAIVHSFRQAADGASAAAGGTVGISPSNIFDVGVQLSNQVLGQVSAWSPGASVGLVIAALVIIICFALIAAFMVLALVESYVVISAGVLLMGFGGSRWTSDYALKIIVYAVSVGAKLFVLQLLVGLGENMIQGWTVNFTTDNTHIFLTVGSAIVMLALTKSVPELVQGLINGASVSQGTALTGAAAAVGGAVAGAASQALGAGAAVGNAVRLASTQLGQADTSGAGAASRLGHLANLTGRAARHLGGAALEDVGRRLSGRAHHGAMTWRMADSLQQRTQDLTAQQHKPIPPATAAQGGSTGSPNVIRPPSTRPSRP